MAKDYIALADLIGRADFLELRCGRCERSGRLSVARLAREYAPDTSLASIMRAQIGDCSKRADRGLEARCDPYSPTLWPLFGGDSQRPDQEPQAMGRQFARTGRPEHPNG